MSNRVNQNLEWVSGNPAKLHKILEELMEFRLTKFPTGFPVFCPCTWGVGGGMILYGKAQF